jgi:hypothetical protein
MAISFKDERGQSSRKAARVSHRSIALDHSPTPVVVSVAIVVAVLLDNDRFVAISAISIPEVFAVAIAMTFTHGHAMRTYSDSDFFRCSRNCAANSGHGRYRQNVFDHCVLPII